MDMNKIMNGRPRIAVLDPNTLAVLGLKNILQNVLPIMEVDSFSSFDEFLTADYFAAQTVVLEHRAFFTERKQKTILLTVSKDSNSQLSGFHTICVSTNEEELVRNLLMIEQYGHAGGKNFPEMPQVLKNKILSNREIEVLSLVVQGFINKEIATKLNISLTTVITHRKNIMEKLGMKSVSALTIYAVMHGYVDISKI